MTIVNHYKFNETSGTTANDSVGSSNLTMSTEHWGSGFVGNGLSSIGRSRDMWATAGSALIPLTAAFSVSAWVYLPKNALPTDVTGQYNMGIVSQWVSGEAGRFILLFANDGHTVENGRRKFSIAFGGIERVLTPVVEEGWHHLVITRSGNTFTFYHNGSSMGTYTATVTVSNTNTQIGSFGSSANNAFAGIIDEVSIYDNALSSGDVTDIYNNGLKGLEYPYTTTDNGWLNFSWSNRIKITIANTKIPTVQTHFPVYLDLSQLPSGFHSNVKTDGSDIRITKGDGFTELPREIVYYDSSTDTGEVYFKAHLNPNVDNEFYIYFGNSSASDYATNSAYGAENVWNSHYLGVYHFNSNSSFLDSTGNSKDGTFEGTPTITAGKFGTALSFNGSSQSVNLGQSAMWGIHSFSVEAVWRTTSTTDAWMFGKYLDVNNRWYARKRDDTSNDIVQQYSLFSGTSIDSRSKYENPVVHDTWYNTTLSSQRNLSASYSFANWYINGVQLIHSTNFYAPAMNRNYDMAADLTIAKYDTSYGTIEFDELRFVKMALAEDWIEVAYDNQFNPSTFYSLSSVQTSYFDIELRSGTSFGIVLSTGEPPSGATIKIKISGTFVDKPIQTKVSGTFVSKSYAVNVS
jgi:hypothetical protein